MSHPRPGPPGPPPHASAPRGSPAPRRPHHVSGCPSPAPGKDLVSPFPGRCNCKPPGARGLYLSRNACPRGRRECSICLPPAKNFFLPPPFARGIPNFNFLFLSSGPRQLESTNSRRGPYCCFFLKAFCLGAFTVPCKSSPHSRPACSSLSRRRWCHLCAAARATAPRSPFCPAVGPVRSPPGGARGGGGWGDERCGQQLPHGLLVRG